jgi:(heptosyl)LPS beta-1,4-glucosyltransferase
MNKISTVIIAKNEEDNIVRCLKSVLWTDEIVVLDTGSEDRTKIICEEMGARVYESAWLGFGRSKQKAVNLAKYDWVLSVDADEQVSGELQKKIKRILRDGTGYFGFKIKEQTFYLGQRIKYSGWNREYHLRLFNRKYGNFNDKAVHESVKIKGPVGRIEEKILHYSLPCINKHVFKMNQYTDMAARELYEKDKKSTPFNAFFRALWAFVRMYFIKLGVLDGRAGFVLAINSAHYVFLKYSKLWELWRRQKN